MGRERGAWIVGMWYTLAHTESTEEERRPRVSRAIFVFCLCPFSVVITKGSS